MENEKLGIENVKEVLKLGFAIGKGYKEAMEDGQVDASDIAVVIPIIKEIGPAFDGIKQVPKEIKDLDSEEAKELMSFAAAELGGVFSDEELIIKIDKGLKAGIAVVEFIKVL